MSSCAAGRGTSAWGTESSGTTAGTESPGTSAGTKPSSRTRGYRVTKLDSRHQINWHNSGH
ncbi:unnamed protein product [Staurois parvus]|uniref:Uncharacterized protein n=1 Tax=Staurois parvus TaxID=386267 RepID=A0ABN9BYK9_9NEOB|nr:unnamed protein product [Staurois parvus]